MHRIPTLTLLFWHNSGVETLLQYLLQTPCTAASFFRPTAWDHLEGFLGSWKQKVSMELWNLSLARFIVALISWGAGILEESFMFQDLNCWRFHSVGNFGLRASCDDFSLVLSLVSLCQLFSVVSKSCLKWWLGFFQSLCREKKW